MRTKRKNNFLIVRILIIMANQINAFFISGTDPFFHVALLKTAVVTEYRCYIALAFFLHELKERVV